MCKTLIDVQYAIDVQSTSDFYVTDICTSDLCRFFQILQFMTVSHFLKSTYNEVTDLRHIPNPNQ